MVVDSTMLDKSGDKREPTDRCSDCGCNLPPPPESAYTNSQSSGLPRPRRSLKTEKPSKCPSCAARHAPRNGRRPHGRVRPDPHSCPLCAKTFISSAHLTLHMASHNKDRKYRCGICGKYFHQPSHLVAHKMTHSGDRPFKCPECGKTFGRASHLKTHRRLHTGERPFKCTFCHKAFTQKAGLMAHVRLHTRDQPHKCEQCGEAFRSLAHLLSHKAQESKQVTPAAAPAAAPAAPAAAPVAPAPVSDQQPKTHDNLADLKCGLCCRTFVRSSYIRLYMRLNKGLRPYHCKVCNKTFVKMETFVNHCDKHLRLKNGRSEEEEEEEEKVVKPPSFVPQSSSAPPVPSEVNTRSRTRAKIKMEA